MVILPLFQCGIPFSFCLSLLSENLVEQLRCGSRKTYSSYKHTNITTCRIIIYEKTETYQKKIYNLRQKEEPK